MEKLSKVLIVLSVLKQGESYGYEIIQKVKDFTAGEIQWQESVIYPVLKKLEDKGKVKSSWKIENGDRPRRYYVIQDEGLRQLEVNNQEWQLVENLFKKLSAPQ
jgi:PadR family transcriptional regulator, regulatory protein PadR